MSAPPMRDGRIYPELARLESLGLAIHEVVLQGDRPDKKVYSITDAGIAALREWIGSPTREPGGRSELVLKAYAIWLADPAQATGLFRDQAQTHARRLAEYEATEAELQRAYGNALRMNTPEFATYATLRRGIGYEREYADWCRWVADQLEAFRISPSASRR